MRTLLLLMLPVLFFSLTAIGQDTLKNGRLTFYRPTFKELLHPALAHRTQARYDSINFTKKPEKKHPVIFIDGGLGVSYAGVTGFLGNYSLNYQTGRSLFTFRGMVAAPFSINFRTTGYYSPYNTDHDVGEYALMYGWRFTNHYNMAVSFSTGIAYDHYYYDHHVYNLPRERINFYNAGIPVEVNWQFYLRRFGPSFGLKFLGDIAPHGYAGFGLDLGFGFHNQPK